MKRNPTIKDIARKLGIAPSTVSRALKDNPELNKETKRKVLEMAREMKYVPNSIALSLRSNKTNTIGVVLPQFVHFFFSTVVSGIEDVAYNKGYQVFITQSNEMYEREVADCQALYNSRADGFLICPSKNTEDYEHIRALIDKGFPVVLFDRHVPDLDCSIVKVDDRKGGFMATQHLIEQGCRKIAYIGGPKSLKNTGDREQGFIEALHSGGIPVDQNLIISVDYPVDSPAKLNLLDQLLTRKPDGVFVHNDMVAIELLQLATQKNLKVPQDIKIIGFSNWFFTRYTSPSLSTIEQNGFEIGRKAAELLLEEIAWNVSEKGFIEPTRLNLEPKVVARDSTRIS